MYRAKKNIKTPQSTGQVSLELHVGYRSVSDPRRVYTIGENLFSTGGRAREGGKAAGARPGFCRSGLREAIETLVSSWTLVIGTGRDSPEGLYDRREFILDWGRGPGRGEGGRGSSGVRAVADFRPGANPS